MSKSSNCSSAFGLWSGSGLAVFLLLGFCSPDYAQSPAVSQTEVNGVTMAVYPVERGADGQQYITTPKGFKVTVPGLGIAPDAHEVAVYRNEQNQFWYVDKNGSTQPVSHAQLQWTMAQIQHQQATRNIEIEKSETAVPGAQAYGASGAQPYGVPPGVMPGAAPGMVPGAAPGMVPGAAPYGAVPMAVTQPGSTVVVNQQPSNSAATSALVSGMAAAGGAMAGSAIAGSMYNHNNAYGVPYGVPMYHAAGHTYYNGADGAHYEVPPSAYNHYADEWNRQAAYQNNSQDRQNAYNNLNKNQQQMLKNQGAVRLNDRHTTESTAAASGEDRAQGDQAVRESRFQNRQNLGGRFRR